ncbi:hypothetical protein SAMN06295926_13513 [Lysinibacillus sp. AC-3]|nr:hypothetical protein SAMN06295926_13513 [Lysinibacillus sp. AC-3]
MGDSSGISDRGTKAKSIMSCDNTSVTNIMLLLSLRFRINKTKTLCCRYVSTTLSRKKHLLVRDPGASIASEAAHRTPPGSFALCESEAAATNVLSVRKRSGSNKAPIRNGNHPFTMLINKKLCTVLCIVVKIL